MDVKKIQRRIGLTLGRTYGRTYGFTLIELTVVLAVTLILSAGVLWSVDTAERRALQNASELLQADLRYTQRMAMLEGRNWQLELLRDSYKVTTSGEGTGGFGREVKLENGIWTITPMVVLYYPRGTISPGGFTITMYSRNRRFSQQLTALPDSGRIEIKPMVSRN